MKNFAIIGVGGYIAPRHLQAIRETGNTLVAALDKSDSVGILDSYFPNADFFTEFERFDRHLDKLKREEKQIDFVSICTPNYLHDAHIRFALKHGANAICEKPLVLNPWNLDALQTIEQETKRKIYTVLQLRLHPDIIALKNRIGKSDTAIFNVNLDYITSRGKWYRYSWKGDEEKSGGIITNIGIHFFDMLIWIFGGVTECTVSDFSGDKASGTLRLERANVSWSLSIRYEDLPESVKLSKKTTFRSLKIDDEEIEFSEGFTNLHTKTYEEILKGNGFGIKDSQASIKLVKQIRDQSPMGRR